MMKDGWKKRHFPEKVDDDADDDDDEEANHAFIYTNEQIQNIFKTTSLRNFISCTGQHLKYIGHILYVA